MNNPLNTSSKVFSNLAEYENSAQKLLHDLPFAVLILDEHYCVSSANKPAVSLLNFNPKGELVESVFKRCKANKPYIADRIKNTPHSNTTITTLTDHKKYLLSSAKVQFQYSENFSTIVLLYELSSEECCTHQNNKAMPDYCQWLLSHYLSPTSLSSVSTMPYGDLTALNKNGEILNSLGKEMLKDIASDFLNLPGINTVIFEKNCHYALNMITNEWCRFLNQATRESVDTESNSEAMESGCWLCHESCSSVAKEAINRSEAVSSKCHLGLNLFAIPIKANREIVGALVFGYGNPYKNPEHLAEIAKKINVDYKKLYSLSYNSKAPPSIITETAKSRLFLSSKLIGTILERKRAEEALKSAYSEVERRVESRTAALNRSHQMLRTETRERLRAEHELLQKHLALENVYSIATSVTNDFYDLYDRIISGIATVLHIPHAALGIVHQKNFSTLSQHHNGIKKHQNSIALSSHPCGIILKDKQPLQLSGQLQEHYPQFFAEYPDMISFIGVPVLGNDKRLIGAICAMDTQPRVFTEYEFQQLEIFSRFLAREIEQSNLEQQLFQNQEMKMLGLLTSGVAHEVRNPLNGILAITEALDMELGKNEEYRPYIEHIRAQVTRLSNLMHELLDLGRPVEKKDMCAFRVKDILKDAISTWQQSSKYKNYKVRLKIRRNVHDKMIICDQEKLQQVMLNLIENACAHSDHTKEVLVSTELAAGEDNIIIKVIDQGSGISPDHLKRLFDPFFTTRKGGTGLGLGIVKKIVESHRGTIQLYNNQQATGCTAEMIFRVEKTNTGET
ncbi:ATP-binding protein [Chitinispirillales bacterium ANBcel5]|uniref:ATP-binding protein n=1 Tax=Cellulosispirillum alkaliphilum TaxID=3039283 RepID=UPI002A587B4E|nr:ATP-binding protein [Chitinispirillales bacterium ANBcel5]